MSKVLVPLATGFEEIEAITIVDILRRAGAEVVLGALESIHVIGAHGIEIKADVLLDTQDASAFDMIVLPGGMPGATNLSKNEKVLALLHDFEQEEKYIAAICAAPLALKAAGVLKHHYTCYPSFEHQILHDGYTDAQDVVCDKNIITSRGPSTAMNFAMVLVEILYSAQKAEKLRKDLLLLP